MNQTATLAHIPGPPTPPLIDHTLTIARDSYGTQKQYIARYGDVYKTKMLGVWRVNLCGADAMEMVLMDRQERFSSRLGWDALQRLYSGGLLLQDSDEHRVNRRIMGSAFGVEAIEDYQKRMAEAMEDLILQWPVDEKFCFYQAIKELTLHLGAAVFMGLPLDGGLARRVNRSIKDEIRASITLIRTPIPLTPMWRGVKGRRFLRETFRTLIAERRDSPGNDFFSQMCVAKDDDGQGWTEDEILDQFNLLIMAAHDTTATALSVMIASLAHHTDWQDALTEEVAALGSGPIDMEMLSAMPQTMNVFKEALRLVPPVPFIPRLALRDFHWHGYDIPAGTSLSLNPGVTMLSPEFYTSPECFDPDRFSPKRAEDQRHKFAWAPFGGGVHKCIGMHFATMQVKLFIATLLRTRHVALADPHEPKWQRMPIPRPKRRLDIVLQQT